MKIKSILVSLGIALPMAVSAQSVVMNTTAQGYLDRGKHMFNNRNYVGALDQLNQAERLGLTGTAQEEAEYYIALSKFERAEHGDISALIDFIENHPSSGLAQWAQLKVGDYYFYRGYWRQALNSYSLVRDGALDGDRDEDLVYRRAYANLMLEEREVAQRQYNSLKRSKRYSQAAQFYKAYISYADGNYAEALTQFTDISQNIDANATLAYQSQYYISQIQFHNKEYNRVIDNVKKLLAEDKNDYFTTELNRIVGESYYHTGNDGSARKHLEAYMEGAAEEEAVPYRTAAYTLGVLDYKRGDYQAALDHMGLATAEQDEMAQSAYLYMAQCRLKQGDEKGAAQAFQNAMDLNINKDIREIAFYDYALTKAKGVQDNFGESIRLFENFLNEYPNSKYKSDVEGYLVDSYMSTNNFDTALESINRLKNPGKKVMAAKQYVLYNLGMQNLDLNTAEGNDKALGYLREAVNLGALDTDVLNESRLWLAEALYRKGDSKSLQEAAKNQKEYVKQTKNKTENAGVAQYNLGYSLFKLEKYDEALAAFQAAVDSKQLPADVLGDTYTRMGDTYYNMQDFAGAMDSYNRSLEVDKNASRDYAMFQIGNMLALSKQYPEAVAQMDKMMAECPKSKLLPKALLEKGNIQATMNAGNDAVATYGKLIKDYPKSAEARKALMQTAIVYMNMSQTDDAVDTYKKVVKSYPSSDEAKAAVEDLKLIYADRSQLADLDAFLKPIKGAPQIKVDEVDKLTFEAAEKDAIDDNPDITRMQEYVANNPTGAYVSKAKYYIARYNYFKGKYDDALVGLDDALSAGKHSSFAEDAMSMRCDILMRQKKYDQALKAYEELVAQASNDDTRITAQLGAMRASKSLEDWNKVKEIASSLLEHGNLNSSEEREATLNRAIANVNLKNTADAMTDLSTLAQDTQSEQGAQATYELALLQFNTGNAKDAEATINAFIDAGTPHSYWLAKAFILLSDIYIKQGKVGDARDYLQSLKSNYPGKEKEILEAIDSRLNTLKNAKTTTATGTKGKNSKKK